MPLCLKLVFFLRILIYADRIFNSMITVKMLFYIMHYKVVLHM